MRTLKRVLAVGAALLGVVTIAAPAHAASVCGGNSSTFCVTKITYSPATVSNTAEHTITMTILATAGFATLDVELNPQSVTNTTRSQIITEGQAGTYTATFVVPKGAKTGSVQPTSITPYSSDQQGVTATQLTAGGITPLTVTGTDPFDQTAPAAAGFSISSTAVQDVTTKNGALGITAHITDAGSGTWEVYAYAQAHTPPSYTSSRGVATEVLLTRTAGTQNDGTWTGTLALQGGTSQLNDLSLSVVDHLGNAATITTAQLAAQGFPSTITTRTTAAPPAPTNYKVVTTSLVGGSLFAHASWTAQQAGKPIATEWLVTASGNCTTLPYASLPGPTSLPSADGSRKAGSGAGLCTLTVKASNAAGVSSAVSGNAFLF